VSVRFVATASAPAGICTEVPPRLRTPPRAVTTAVVVCVWPDAHRKSVGDPGCTVVLASCSLQSAAARPRSTIATSRVVIERKVLIFEIWRLPAQE
jgi:hypothetical protein